MKINKAIKIIRLAKNKIRAAGAQDLVEALKVNKTITTIDLGDNRIGDVDKQARPTIVTLEKRNKTKAIELINVVKKSDVNTVKNLLDEGVSVNYQDGKGNTALHYAVQQGHQAIIDLLVALPYQQLLANKKGELPKVNTKPNATSVIVNSVNAKTTPIAASSSSGTDASASIASSSSSSMSDKPATLASSVSLSASSSSSSSSLSHLQTIPWHNLVLNEQDLLGHGAYGDVYRAKWLGTDVAVKVLHLKKLSLDLQQDFEREASIMAQCHFPHVVRLYGIVAENQHYALVMEYLNQGSLYDALHQKDLDLPWTRRWEIAIGIAKGLAYLHGRNILHRDLKSMNILLTNGYQPKITDFGLSRIKIETNTVTTLAHKNSGSIRWRAPELFKPKAKYTPACDVYSLGMVFWELAARTVPFCDEKDDQMVISWIKDGEQETIPEDCPSTFAELIKACWHKNPDNRPTAETILALLEQAKPQPPKVAQISLETKAPTKSWHFAQHLLEQANTMVEGNGFALIPADSEDIGKVVEFYSHHAVPGYDLKRVDIIYNRGQNQIFERRLKLLDDRGHPASAAAFAPKWSTEYGAAWRAEVDKLALQTALPYQDPDFPNVKLLPLWHGTQETVLESLLRTGYANLATTDSGFFGKGIYTTGEAEYAYRVYSQKGPLILNWVAFFSAYPTIDGDMAKLAEKSNYQNYDAHFVPVVPASNKPTEVNYYPTKAQQKHVYTELVVFDPNQCLPRYLVELQPTLPKAPANLGGSPHSLFFKGKVDEIIYVNLLAAANYAYENYLSKPYTLKEGTSTDKNAWQLDWQYQHPTNGKVIPRPNHGLAHTLRKLLYLPSILEHYIAHQNLSENEARLLKNDIKVMQLALLFFISGRENDLGSQGNEIHFQRFRKQSADNFERYIEAAGIKLSSEKILVYKEAMLWFDNHEDKGLVKHIRQILWQCHFIDLIRCLTPEQFNGAIGYVDKNIGQARREQLTKLAQLCLEKTGDRLMAIESKKGYQPDLFVEASSSVKTCFKYLQNAYRAFEMETQSSSSLSKLGL